MDNPFEDKSKFTADVIQYRRPHGEKVWTSTQLDARLFSLYTEMKENGCRFEAEILTTDEVSLTISRHDHDLDIEIVSNGPEVQQALEKLLQRRPWERPDDLDKDGDPEKDPE